MNSQKTAFFFQDLNCLIERYLEPLKEETFLSGEGIEQLFGNIQEIVTFQKMFLMSLEECVELEPNFSVLTEPAQFRVRAISNFIFVISAFHVLVMAAFWPVVRMWYCELHGLAL